ncbi:MAG: 3-hydroxyacyl-CoA dehydrogenase [Phycisphaerales bacterium]|nr:MAG: 3-hydroxyacyl-CoA dehydrogenase [Phycisphaerales bacterium]
MSEVGIIGAGTMGSGIAQVAAVRGWTVRLMDVSTDVAQRAIQGIASRLDRLVEKSRMSRGDRDAAVARLHVASEPAAIAECDLIVEAVVEDLDQKVGILERLIPALRSDCTIATNTSSLSVGQIGRRLGEQARVVGMHFFNPVPLMPLVEVIRADGTSQEAADRVAQIGRAWGKTVVRCKDTPGFIVNRVARGYYLEPLRMLGEGLAGVDEIDGVMKRLGGFRMGPFELTDLVGIDVNYTVSCSVWEQMGRPARLKPHEIQVGLFQRGELGRKTGRGFYEYGQGAAVPVVMIQRQTVNMPPEALAAAEAFCGRAVDGGAAQASLAGRTERYIFARVLATIINEAALAFDDGVATSDDIDAAMKLGTNYPHGPLEWADAIGFDACLAVLEALNATCDDGRFAPARLLGGGK